MKAVFLDRDGVINELVYHHEAGVLDSPFMPGQFKLLPKVGRAIKEINRLGLKAVIVSNQPGVGKKHFSKEVLEKIDKKMVLLLEKSGAYLDAIYYCLHHPKARDKRYRKNCTCRKPKSGLLLTAAKKLHINLRNSYMVGDNITDIQAGQRMGCQTFMLSNLKCDLCKLMKSRNVEPNYITPNLWGAIQIIKQKETNGDIITKQRILPSSTRVPVFCI